MIWDTDKTTIEVDDEGTKYWLVNGELHRIDGPAVEWACGGKEWCVEGVHHRIEGPAIYFEGRWEEWYINGELHRTDGPARWSEHGVKEWWLYGRQRSYDEWKDICYPFSIACINTSSKLKKYTKAFVL